MLCLVPCGLRAAPLDAELPFVLRAGLGGSGDPAGAGERVLADLPFSSTRGYGHVGGRPGRLSESEGRPLEAGANWELAWREGPSKYSFRLANGDYLLGLSFIETDTAQPGVRVFDIAAEGRELVRDLDLAREAGDFRWLTLEWPVTVRDGWLDIEFGHDKSRLPGRVSRIRVAPLPGPLVDGGRPVVPLLEARPEYERVVLRWTLPVSPPRSAPRVDAHRFAIYRSELSGGPYESLTAYPVLGREFIDRTTLRGTTYHYRVRAFAPGGEQSALSAPVSATPRAQVTESPRGRKIYELRVADDDLPRLMTRTQSDEWVPAQLAFYGRSDRAEVRTLGGRDWGERKSFHVDLDTGERFFGREELLFLAENGDPTFLREMLYHEIARSAGLPAPRVEVVELVVNGEHLGTYLEREVIDSEFLERARLDRRGTLVRTDLHGALPLTWKPYGEQIGRGGSGLVSVTLLYHELMRIEEAECARFFEERFVLDRLIDRLAVDAILGARDDLESPALLLGDSRTSKWELLGDRAPSGTFGIVDFRAPARDAGAVGPDAVGDAGTTALFQRSLRDSALPLGETRPWRAIETRLFNEPGLRRRFVLRVRELLETSFDADVITSTIAKVADLLAGFESSARERWPHDDGAAFREGPARIARFLSARREALLREVELELERLETPPEPLVLGGFLLSPGESGSSARAHSSDEGAEGREAGREAEPDTESAEASSLLVPSNLTSLDGAWIEIRNRSTAPVDLSAYALTTDPARPRAWRFPARELAPGERVRVTLGSGRGPLHARIRPSPGGGALILAREDERGRMRVADLACYGWQTPGVARRRTDDGAWTIGNTSGGERGGERGEAGDQQAALPHWRFRWEQGFERNGALRISMAPRGEIARVTACFRLPGEADFRMLPMEWEKTRFHYECKLPPGPGGVSPPRMELVFVARSESGLERVYPLTGTDLTVFTPSRPKLFINEVLPRPSRIGGFQEFIEIYNGGDEPVSVDGMYLTDRRRNTVRWRLEESTPIPPKGFLVLYAQGAAGVPDRRRAPFRLSNSGEYLGLFHRWEEGNIPVDQMAFTAVPVDHSWGRREDGKKGSRHWKDPTPGGRNQFKIPEEYRRKSAEGEQGEE